MTRIAIIPARGGSKRIPNKNVKIFIDKPILHYSINAATESGLFDEIMVSTDDDKIKQIALECGAKVPFMRSKRNSDDYATTIDVLLEVLESYQKLGVDFEFGCCIYPTAVFINSNLLKNTFDKLVSEKYDTVFPVLRYSFPIQRALRINSNDRVELLHPEFLNTRSQDLDESYHDAGQFYWFKSDVLRNKAKLWTNNSGVEIISEMHAQDIDNQSDWEIAEFKYQFLRNDHQ